MSFRELGTEVLDKIKRQKDAILKGSRDTVEISYLEAERLLHHHEELTQSEERKGNLYASFSERYYVEAAVAEKLVEILNTHDEVNIAEIYEQVRRERGDEG